MVDDTPIDENPTALVAVVDGLHLDLINQILVPSNSRDDLTLAFTKPDYEH